MRYPAGQKSETHEKIVAGAAQSYRQHGSDGKGIAQLMKDLGLTHGGFYRHFESKEDLFAEVVARGFEETGDRLVAAASAAPGGQELLAVIETYLSASHLDNRGTGCVIAALGPELARLPPAVRKRINATIEAYIDRLAKFVPGRSEADRRREFVILFSGMAGAVVTARAFVNPKRRLEILSAAKDFYLKAFAGQAG